jgi:WD40 repeat protein
MKAISRLWAFAVSSLGLVAIGCMPNQSEADSSQQVASRVTEFHESWEAWSLAFSPDNQELATSSPTNDEVHIWHWKGQDRIAKTLKTLRAGNPNGLRYSPNGRLLAGGHPVADGDKLLRVWNSSTGAVQRDISDPIGGSRFFGIAFSPDSRLLMRSQETGALAGENFVWETL